MSRWPLRVQLPVIAIALLLIAEAAVGALALTLLHRSLIDQVDERLAQALSAVLDRPRPGAATPRETIADLPSDYVVLYHDGDGQLIARLTGRANEGAALPELAVDPSASTPYTALDSSAFARWRVATAAAAQGRGTVSVALPLRDVAAATAQLRRTLVAAFLATAAVGGVAAWAATRRALRPLRDAEATAAAIVAGNLSRRVAEGAEGTESGSLARSLNAMLDRLDASFAARDASDERLRSFVSDASHELRTPLAAIRGYAELQRIGAAGPDAAERIEVNAIRMGALVDDLLTLARYDEAPSSLAGDEAVDLGALAQETARDVRAQDSTRDVSLSIATDVPRVRGSARHLRQVLANIGGNAVRHTPPGSAIDIAVRADDGGVLVSIADHGPGIPAKDRQRIFERFARPDASRSREDGGSGLGLAIVAAIVDAHGGTVRAEEADSGGARFVVRLPAAP